ncbi:MAG: sensor histidine kinase [Terracidiphilus sp.]|jgi:signal transduction histidine kinase
MPDQNLLKSGSLPFTIESRVLRELGERLVKEPEVALNELIKNSYDADAGYCRISISDNDEIVVEDNGHGMTLEAFTHFWMRIGTSSKTDSSTSKRYGRLITGEKGIGRFAVRFLGQHLKMETIAYDSGRKTRTKLTARFDWPLFDKEHDLGKIGVPYSLRRAPENETEGTTLTITKLRPEAHRINLRTVRTGSLAVLSPFASLMKQTPPSGGEESDPGFQLLLSEGEAPDEVKDDVARKILESFVLKGTLDLTGDKLLLKVFQKDEKKPYFSLSDRITNDIGPLHVDLRFFPQRGGTFRGLPLDGRIAKTWVKTHSGVAVFDRTFRVHPYGTEGDDWLSLDTDSAKNVRFPRSSLSEKHFPMDEATRKSTELNYMLRLPHSEQVIGVVQVSGVRGGQQRGDGAGLIAAADREGFLRNSAFNQLEDLVRGVAEAIAYVDREIQLATERRKEEEKLEQLRRETREAVAAIEGDPNISASVKRTVVQNLLRTQESAEQVVQVANERQATLEVMSLMGVVAGFMTHEFGTALHDLERVRDRLNELGKKDPVFRQEALLLTERLVSLQDFVTYSQGYVRGAAQRPSRPYPAQPRVQQVIRVFGKYAEERDIRVEIEIGKDVLAPLVPPSLYNGLALNLYTNALKAVTAASNPVKKEIAFRAWNEKATHFLEVSDTGVGIPEALKPRIFDPLFTTTAANRDPLGSGLGLGLALVRRCAQAFGGSVEVVDPPPGFSTCFRVRLPLTTG